MVYRRLLILILISIILLVVGSLGYVFIEGWSFFDSLYMTVITLTTVGYLEVHEMSNAGRAFTMLLALSGVFTLFYAGAEVLRFIVSGEVNRTLERQRMKRSLADLHDHMIICGFGRMGRLVCQEFSTQGLPFVVIDANASLLEGFQMEHGLALPGDATMDEVLKRAGIDRARALVSVLSSDADNLYITMSARLLNDKLTIVARVEDVSSEQKLIRAGANRVVSPYQIGGFRVAQAVVRPTVVDFVELATRTEHFALQIEEMQIAAGSQLAGATIQASRLRQEFGVIIVAIKKTTGHMVFNPPHDATMDAGDILIAIGERKQLDELEKRAGG